MPLSNPVFRVLVRNPTDPTTATEHTVEVTNGDRLRAELEAGRAGLPPMREAPLNHTALWVWAAMVRTGAYTGKSAVFRSEDLVNLEPVEDEAGDPALVPVDPTRPEAPTGSP